MEVLALGALAGAVAHPKPQFSPEVESESEVGKKAKRKTKEGFSGHLDGLFESEKDFGKIQWWPAALDVFSEAS